MALSSVEVKYMATSIVACEAIWLRKILMALFGQEMDVTVIYCGNQSCIKLSKNLVFRDKSKHIDIWYHFIRDYLQKGVMRLEYVKTNEQVADIFIMDLIKGNFVKFQEKVGIVQNPFLAKKEC